MRYATDIDSKELLTYLKNALPMADRVSLKEEQLVATVDHAILVRDSVPWSSDIPEDVFKAFVVFPRVNNERITDHRELIWNELRERVQGKSMTQAVLEVNYWCYEKATYQSTDDRTLDALGVMKRAYGRCGEESTLLVSALRAVGIPARQVYVPRWAHCDDNHAWVEAWADGSWHYLGACEPEPVLDSGWFTAAASKAMLVHTRAYGILPEGERVECATDHAWIINRTAAYAKTALLKLHVTENGRPCPGLTVRFELANMAELYPICEKKTDADGEASFVTGLGTLHLHIHDGERFVMRMVDVSREAEIQVDFAQADVGLKAAVHFDQRPPLETRMQPADFPIEIAREHEKRLHDCEMIRAAYEAGFPRGSRYLGNARGNWTVIRDFLNNPKFELTEKQALLDTLREKDFVDIDLQTLTDALRTALSYKDKYSFEIWKEGVLAPRISNEALQPIRGYIRERLAERRPEEVQALWTMLEKEMRRCEMLPAEILPDLRGVLESGLCSAAVLDILFVACARALGFAARLNPITKEKEIYDGGWHSLNPAHGTDAAIVLHNGSGFDLQYGVHFTIGMLQNGRYATLDLRDVTLKDTLELPICAGEYRIVVTTRQIDGAVDGTMMPLIVHGGETAEATLRARPDRSDEKRIGALLPTINFGNICVPDPGKNTLAAVIAPGQEPTEHLLNELLEDREKLKGIAVRLILLSSEGTENAKLGRVLAELSDAKLLISPDHETIRTWRERLHAGDLRLPLAVAIDSEGKGLFALTNYNVGTVKMLIGLLNL